MRDIESALLPASTLNGVQIPSLIDPKNQPQTVLQQRLSRDCLCNKGFQGLLSSLSKLSKVRLHPVFELSKVSFMGFREVQLYVNKLLSNN
jgi:hypothetical protein